MSEKIIPATLDTTVILGAVGNPSGPNASVIAHGIAGVYTMVLSQSVIAEALSSTPGIWQSPTVIGSSDETPFGYALSTLVEPSQTRASATNDAEHDSYPT